MPAARASWLALPATNDPNVNVGLRLPGSTRRGANGIDVPEGAGVIDAGVSGLDPAVGAVAGAITAGPGALEAVAAAASATANSTAIASPVAWRASVSIRPPKRSFTHWSTNRLGAISRSRPDSSAQDSGRIHVANCWGVSSRSNASRHAVHAGDCGTECKGRRPEIDRALRRDATFARLAGVAL